MLFGYQPQPCRQLPAIGEILRVANRRHQRAGRDQSNAGYLLQLARQGVGAVPCPNLHFHLGYLPVQFLEVLQQALHQFPERTRQFFFRFVEQHRHALVEVRYPLRQDQSEFTQQAANLVGLRRSRLHQPLPHPVQRQHRLLLNILDRHEPHVRTSNHFADRLGVGRIVLVRLDVRLDELRRHQLDRMAEPLPLPCPVMGAAARFHVDQARRQSGKKHRHLVALKLLPEHRLALRIHAVDLKHVLCQIDADCRNLHGDASLGSSGCSILPLWHIRCRYEWGRPSHWDKEVSAGSKESTSLLRAIRFVDRSTEVTQKAL